MLWIFNQFSGHLVCEINHGRFDDFITSFVPSSIYKFMGSFRVDVVEQPVLAIKSRAHAD